MSDFFFTQARHPIFLGVCDAAAIKKSIGIDAVSLKTGDRFELPEDLLFGFMPFFDCRIAITFDSDCSTTLGGRK
ncbi:hypothetical protein [Ruegeria lacuscaerulensis]|uniref:hypothetical protein n=1 Tax=Ruegeria lacuscaerulensis TaxID=55218 RepID=UPI00147E5C83|nr:hypothetical protein [Ruegeria lacuscaerulensis]